MGHVGSNKGGVASYVWVWDTSVCFVNSHLAAHQGKTARRNSDYREIVEQISLGDVGLDILHQFHHTVWMGDLNYRLDLGEVFGPSANAKTPPKEVFDKIQEMCAKGDTAEMLKCDQLRKSIAENKGFVGFKEGDITHLPTFKVKREKGFVYNTQRSPAYCDRILWRSLPGLSAKQTGLWCAPEVETSDHKPVACTLELDRHQSRPRWLPRKAKNVLAGQVRRSVRAPAFAASAPLICGEGAPVLARRLPGDFCADAVGSRDRSKRTTCRTTTSQCPPGSCSSPRWRGRTSCPLTTPVRGRADTPADRAAWRLRTATGPDRRCLPLDELALPTMNPAGKSDPYVIFFGDALMQPVRSPAETSTIPAQPPACWARKTPSCARGAPHSAPPAPAPFRQAHTDYETQTLQPKWNPKRLPKVTVFAASEEAMMNEHIQIVVMDYDAVRARGSRPAFVCLWGTTLSASCAAGPPPRVSLHFPSAHLPCALPRTHRPPAPPDRRRRPPTTRSATACSRCARCSRRPRRTTGWPPSTCT